MLTWLETEKIIASRELHKLVRSPEQISEYRHAKERFNESHGGVAQFVIAERLKWAGEAARAKGTKFLGDTRDTQILPNDFSYDFEKGIRHFVVWSKLPIPCNDDEFPTPEAKVEIEKYINKYFCERAGIPRKNVQWFKNILALQSIPSVSHFHVLVRECDDKLTQKILEPLRE